MRQRGEQVNGLGGYFKLLNRQHSIQGAHIMQTIGQLDQHYPQVVRKGKQHLLVVFGLLAGICIVENPFDFGESVNNPRYFIAKLLTNTFKRIIRIFHNVVQECADDRGFAKANFPCTDTCNFQGVIDVWFTTAPAHIFMGLHSNIKSLPHFSLVSHILIGAPNPQQVTVALQNFGFFFNRIRNIHAHKTGGRINL